MGSPLICDPFCASVYRPMKTYRLTSRPSAASSRRAISVSVASALCLLGLGAVTGNAARSIPRDGEIAFMRPGSVGEYDLWIVKPDGTGLRRLTRAPRNRSDYNPRWSPDGSAVVFERRVLTDAGGDDLYSVPAGGGRLRRLTDCSGDCWSDSEARFSVDGAHIAFGRATGPRTSQFPSTIAIQVMNADGSDVRQLTYPPAGLEDHEPSWSPDGRTIVFQRDTTTSVAGPTKLISVNVQTGGERVVYALPRWSPGSGLASLSPDGTRILFGYWCRFGDSCPAGAFGMRNSRLATIRPNGSGLKTLPINLRADSGAWAPSGRQIVFRCHAPVLAGTSFKLCTSRLDGTHLKQFPWAVGSAHPSWGTHP
jgi:Tol biopolymer transport system component